eukprot:00545_1
MFCYFGCLKTSEFRSFSQSANSEPCPNGQIQPSGRVSRQRQLECMNVCTNPQTAECTRKIRNLVRMVSHQPPWSTEKKPSLHFVRICTWPWTRCMTEPMVRQHCNTTAQAHICPTR